MKSQVFSSLLILLHTITAAIITLALTSCAEDHDEQFSRCSHLLRCGESVQNIGYPFWGGGNRPQECGLQGFQLKCDEEEDGVFPTIDISNQTFRVLSINTSNHLLRIAHNICPRSYKNTTLNVSPFRHSPDHDQMLNLFYACPDYYYNYTSTRNRFVCNINGTESFGYYNYTSSSSLELPNNGQGCELNVTVPVLGTAIEEFRNNESITLQQLLNQGFTVEYRMMDNVGCLACERSGGSCLSGIIMNTTSSQPNCLCGHELHHLVCTQNQGSELNVPRKIAIGIGAAAFGAIVMWIIFYMYHRRLKKRHSTSSMASRDIFSYPTSVADLEKAGNYYGVHVFNYDELEEATNNFDSNKELGDGGFGTVYKGKLRDGRVVAIKRLYENNYKRVEQFMNEVEILTLLRHKNLVTLYGCTSYRGLVLVYEYIPNGTVADHLHGERAKPGLPSWTTRLNIAIETASALAYLHASGVIHRDVKTNNILLDANFSVKVADFGLSRLFPANATHVSTAPQGTPGYVDPEYHQYYHLTDRSDVYSFGVVLIELISSKPAVDITRHRHEINLSNMAVNKIQSHALHELVDPCLGFESDSKVKTMITAVAELAFQCLQLGREMRPSMQEVLEVLQGIQSNNSIIKAEEMDIPADDVLLLKNDALACSPDSETVSCRSAIPYASG